MVEALNSPTVLPSQPLAHSHGTTRSVLHSAGNTSGAGCDVVHPGFDLKKTLFIYLFIYLSIKKISFRHKLISSTKQQKCWPFSAYTMFSKKLAPSY